MFTTNASKTGFIQYVFGNLERKQKGSESTLFKIRFSLWIHLVAVSLPQVGLPTAPMVIS